MLFDFHGKGNARVWRGKSTPYAYLLYVLDGLEVFIFVVFFIHMRDMRENHKLRLGDASFILTKSSLL